MTRSPQTPLALVSETSAKAIPRTQGLALYAARALALAALGQNTHAATLAPMVCGIDDGLLWILGVSVLVVLALIGAFLGLEVLAYRAGAVRIARALESHGGDARMPELPESGPRAIARLARAINKGRRRRVEREAEHLDVQAAYASAHTRERVRASTALCLIEKPIDAAELEAWIRHALHDAGARR